MSDPFITAYEIGEDGDRWMVKGTTDSRVARLAVIKFLLEQTWPIRDLNSVTDCEIQIRDALELAATEYRFVVGDRDSEKVYHDANFGPYDAYENNAYWFGSCVAIGFTMPKWSDR